MSPGREGARVGCSSPGIATQHHAFLVEITGEDFLLLKKKIKKLDVRIIALHLVITFFILGVILSSASHSYFLLSSISRDHSHHTPSYRSSHLTPLYLNNRYFDLYSSHNAFSYPDTNRHYSYLSFRHISLS